MRQNHSIEINHHTKNIKSFSFKIPELIEWLDLFSIDIDGQDDDFIVKSLLFDNILLKSDNPYIDIFFERSTSFLDITDDRRTSFTLKNEPRINVVYSEPVDLNQVNKDINMLMQFFALLIGYISNAIDIRLALDESDKYAWLYINRDLSYNTRTAPWPLIPLTKIGLLQKSIQCYFNDWYTYFNDDKFSLVIKSYFAANRKKDMFVEDIFIEYIRILEGYHLRKYGDIDDPQDFIRELKGTINSDAGKALLTPFFDQHSWRINSDHSTKIATWIANGFFGRLGLQERLKQLDDDYFGIIALNAESILYSIESGDRITEYFKRIGATRNYIAHYKDDNRNLLNSNEIIDTVEVLKALIIMIFYSHMGMELDEIRKTVAYSRELGFRTKYLRKEKRDENA